MGKPPHGHKKMPPTAVFGIVNNAQKRY